MAGVGAAAAGDTVVSAVFFASAKCCLCLHRYMFTQLVTTRLLQNRLCLQSPCPCICIELITHSRRTCHCTCCACCVSRAAIANNSLSIANALQSDPSSTRCPDLADEFIHPHTEWMLKQPLAKYVLDPQPVYMRHTKPTASGGLAAASGTPSGPSNDASGPALEADTATQRDPSPEAAQTPRLTHTAPMATTDDAQSHVLYSAVQDQNHGTEQGQAANEQATPALSGFSASQPTDTPDGTTPAGELCLFCIVCRCPISHLLYCTVLTDRQVTMCYQHGLKYSGIADTDSSVSCSLTFCLPPATCTPFRMDQSYRSRHSAWTP